jgi:origin recognition complex subunit 6
MFSKRRAKSTCFQGNDGLIREVARGRVANTEGPLRLLQLTNFVQLYGLPPIPFPLAIMSKKSVEDALQSLLPTYPDPLPSELITLALSLLSQSRTRASSLKPEEEIARPYACANIACERYCNLPCLRSIADLSHRLKISLNLPKPVPRPPCAPRVYKKLYTYLENALPAKQPRRSPGNASEAFSPAKPATPSKAKARPTQSATLVKDPPQPSKKQAIGNGTDKNQVSPKETMPAIRHLCKALKYPTLVPHIFAGLESTYRHAFPSAASTEQSGPPSTPRKGRRATEVVTAEIPTEENMKLLLVAVFVTSMVKVKSVTLVSTAFVLDNGKKAIGVLGIEPEHMSQVEDLIVKVSNLGSTDMEWFENLPVMPTSPDEGENDGKDTAADEEPEVGQKRSRGLGEERGGLQAGLGTMMQDRIDWLSEEKRLDYEDWRAEIMERLDVTDTELGSDIMVE